MQSMDILLNYDVIIHISSFLNQYDYICLSKTNKYMYSILTDNINNMFSLNIGRNSNDNTIFEMVKKYNNVCGIVLTNCSGLTEHSFKLLSFCKYLEYVEINGHTISNNILKHLSSCHNVKSLNISWNTIVDKPISNVLENPSNKKIHNGLSSLTKLEILKVNGCSNLENLLYDVFPKLPKLKSLEYKFNKIDRYFCYSVLACANLKHLDIGSKYVKDSHIKIISNNLNLESIDLSSSTNISDLSVKYLSTMKIAILDLAFCLKLTDKMSEYLLVLSNLCYIRLSGCNNLTDITSENISKLKNVKSVDVSEIDNLTDSSIKSFHKNNNIKMIDITNCYKITIDAIKYLGSGVQVYFDNNTDISDIQDKFRHSYIRAQNRIINIIKYGQY